MFQQSVFGLLVQLLEKHSQVSSMQTRVKNEKIAEFIQGNGEHNVLLEKLLLTG